MSEKGMKITVGDVTNNRANVRDYMDFDDETGRIYVQGEHLATVLIDRSDEWENLKEKNKRYRELLEKIENNMGITDAENDSLLEEIDRVLKDDLNESS